MIIALVKSIPDKKLKAQGLTRGSPCLGRGEGAQPVNRLFYVSNLFFLPQANFFFLTFLSLYLTNDNTDSFSEH